MKRLLLAILALLPAAAYAEPLTFLWDHGQSGGYEAQLLRYEFYKNGSLKAHIPSPGVGTPPPTTYTLTDKLPVGTHRFYVTAVDRKFRKSGPSNVLEVVIAPVATPTPTPAASGPLPPQNFRQ